MLDGRALEADAHAVRLLGDAILGLHEGLAATRAEIIVLRSPHDTDRTAAVVEWRAEPPVVPGRRMCELERQHVADGKLATLEAADPGASVGRKAAHERGQRQAARDREIGGGRSF